MAKITFSLVLLLLAVAAATIPAPAGAAAGGSDAALKKAADFLEKLKKYLEGAKDIFEAINKSTDGSLLPHRGNDEAAGLLPAAVPVDVVQAGGVRFPVAGVDVTSAVTRTSRCGGGEAVPCGDPLCKLYGACGGGGRACHSAAPAGLPLHEGKIALLGAKDKSIFSSNNAAYACHPNAPAGGDDYAVIGLGWGNVILPENATSSSRIFSYILDDDLQGSTVWVGRHAILAEAAAGANRKSTNVLRGNSTGCGSRLYCVRIAGIKVGSGEVSGGEERSAVGIMTTTIPFTFLVPALFDHLEQELPAVASPVNRSRQLCYPSGTELPAITLVFAAAGNDAAEMKLWPEHYSYKKSNGVVCLSILRSPWSFSDGPVSVIGSMVQAGRRMTYKLDDNTLTFDDAASASSKPSSMAQAKLTPCFLFVVLLLNIIM